MVMLSLISPRRKCLQAVAIKPHIDAIMTQTVSANPMELPSE